MTTDNLSIAGVPADGAVTPKTASAPGGLWKAGIAAAVVAVAALVFVSGCGKRSARSARSSDGDTSSERDSRKEGGSHEKATRPSDDTSSERDGRKEQGSHGKVQLWKDGPYWAETNIGAENPEDCGYYFWWGDTVGYRREKKAWVASNGLVSAFSFTTNSTPTYNKDFVTLQSERWTTADKVLAPEHDAAHVHWGGDWRMPTKQELRDLEEKCDWTWTARKGVEGYVVQGRGNFASASIFLPCAGYGYRASLSYAGSLGYYWSSVPSLDYNYSWSLSFHSDRHKSEYLGYRIFGQSVRPVQGFTKQRTK